MKILVTGSSGHLGEAVVRTLQKTHHPVVGIDKIGSTYTSQVGSISDREFVKRSVQGVDAIIHSATLHKPHVATHTKQDFIDTNITGTLNLLEEASTNNISAFVFTSTTSAFGHALTPPPGTPAAWITEEVNPIPKNIYGVTKIAAEDLCELFHRLHKLSCIILRTSRFFPEEDDNPILRESYADSNLKVNEFLHRRVDIQDVVDAHLLALEKATTIGFRKYIISATTPFHPSHLSDLRSDTPQVVKRLLPEYEEEYIRRGWKMFPSIERVYVNDLARQELGWQPKYDFRKMIDLLKQNEDPGSLLSRIIGSKGYHDQIFTEGPYPLSEGTTNRLN